MDFYHKCLRTEILYVTFLNVLILGIVHIFLPSLLSADQPDKIVFDHISVEQGLSNNEVFAIIQDRQGFMWFGTGGGLNRYDGYDCKVYKHDPQNPRSISNNSILTIYEDRSGILWIGTHSGLNKFDRNTERFTQYLHNPEDPRSLNSNEIRAIYEDHSGTLWVGTTGGLHKFDRDTGQFMRYQQDPENPHSLSSNIVTTIYEDQAGGFWIGTYDAGLNKFDRTTGEFVHYHHAPEDPYSLNSPQVRVICEDPTGTLWIGTSGIHGGGINRFDRETGQFFRYNYDPLAPPDSPDADVQSMLADHTGGLWIGTANGLNFFDRENERFMRYKHDSRNPHSLSNNSLSALYVDSAGILWIATSYGGVDKFDPQKQKFRQYASDPEDPYSIGSNCIFSFVEDQEGMVWIGTCDGGGLNKFDRGTGRFIRYQHDKDDPQSSVMPHAQIAVYSDHADTLWIGYWDGGLDKFDRNTGKVLRHYQHNPDDPRSLSHNVILTIYEDHTGVFWVGTGGGGLNRLDREQEHFFHYKHDPHDPYSLSSNFIQSIYEDHTGRLWIGTNNGLNTFNRDTEQFQCYYHDEQDPLSISSDTVTAIYEDHTGVLWIGTNNGLNKFDRTKEQFIYYRMQDGLAGDEIAGILEDRHGNLWITTSKGVSKFNPHIETFKNYDKRDGLQDNGFLVNSTFKSRSGEMFFGTSTNGFNAFYPDEVQDNPFVPPIVLTNFQLFNKAVAIGADSPFQQSITTTGEISLSYKDYVFSFEFAALDYSIPERNQYAYMLEGFDKDWSYVGTRRMATYTNLSPGKYTFRVKGTNSDGIWNEEGTSIGIIVTPPWWETTWFQILMIVTAVAVVIGGYRWRVRAVEARSRKLERQVAARTEELSESNRQLEIAKEAALEAKTEAEVANQAKSTFITNMSHELRTPLNAILGYTQLLRRERMSMDSQYDAIDTIHRSGEYLLLMINELLDLSRIETRRIELKPTNVHLPGFLKSISEMIRIQAQKKDIAFHTDISAEIPKMVLADEKRLRQILLNLLNNAVKFTEEGSVTLRVSCIDREMGSLGDREIGRRGDEEIGSLGDREQEEISPHLPTTPSPHLHFEVEDTGIGIPSEQIQDIFLPFHRIDNAHTEREGTGLGLAISQQLVRLMGSELQVKSVVGQGTTFWFDVKFPELILDETEEDREKVAGVTELSCRIIGFKDPLTGSEQAKRKILLVDDNAENRTLLRDTLAPLGFDIIEASNGHEALHVVRESPPDLILMDLLMPDMDGFEATRQIREEEQRVRRAEVEKSRHEETQKRKQSTINNRQSTIRAVIIGVSASVSSQVRQDSITAGCNDFLGKPIQIDELLDCLHRHLALEWIYEDTAKDDEKQQLSEAAPLIIPPQETLLPLLESAKGGRITDIRKSIKTMKESDHNLVPFADRIRQLVKDYQFEQIIELIESSLKGEE